MKDFMTYFNSQHFVLFEITSDKEGIVAIYFIIFFHTNKILHITYESLQQKENLEKIR